MTLEHKAFVARVMAQATGRLTGDAVLFESGLYQQSSKDVDKLIVSFAHSLDAQLVSQTSTETTPR